LIKSGKSSPTSLSSKETITIKYYMTIETINMSRHEFSANISKENREKE
jgi:hypothetical protein